VLRGRKQPRSRFLAVPSQPIYHGFSECSPMCAGWRWVKGESSSHSPPLAPEGAGSRRAPRRTSRHCEAPRVPPYVLSICHGRGTREVIPGTRLAIRILAGSIHIPPSEHRFPRKSNRQQMPASASARCCSKPSVVQPQRDPSRPPSFPRVRRSNINSRPELASPSRRTSCLRRKSKAGDRALQVGVQV